MTDPFADLLSSFKSGQTPSDSKPSSLKNASLNDLLSSRSAVNSLAPVPVTTTTTTTTPPLQKMNDLSGDLFDDLLSKPITQNKKVESPLASASTKDDFDLVFESLNSPPPAVFVQNENEVEISERTPKQEGPVKQEEPVVDEVKDMEISKIMSLGISFEKSVRYYEKGILYEQLLDRKLNHKTRSGSENPDSSYAFSSTSSHTSYGQTEETPAFLAMASKFFNKGKDFIEDKIIAPLQHDDLEQRSPPQSHLRQSRHPNGNSLPKKTPLARSEFFGDNDATGIHSIDQLSIQENKSTSAIRRSESSPKPQNSPLPAGSGSEPQSKLENDTPVLLDFDAGPETQSSSQYHISEFELTSFNEFKNNGVKLFGSGDFHGAFSQFEKSLNTLPTEHPLRIISLSNMISCQLKMGENSKALKTIDVAIEMIKKCPDLSTVIEQSSPPRTYKQMSEKIESKHAEIYEHMENYDKALSIYTQLISDGVTDRKIMEGKRRCEKIVNPEKFKPKPPKTVTKPSINTSQVKSTSPSLNSDALHKIKEDGKKKAQEEEKRLELYDKVNEKIKKWSYQHEKDLRYLLVHVDPLLKWTSWKPVSPEDVVLEKKVKLYYLKAIAKTHPDKIPSDTSLENIMVAENVYMTLNKAWEDFKSTNNV